MARGSRAGFRGVISAGGQETLHCRLQRPADELDLEPLSMFDEEADPLGQGRSSFFVKNMLTVLGISLALRSSAFSRRSRFVFLDDTSRDVGALPGIDPAAAMSHV